MSDGVTLCDFKHVALRQKRTIPQILRGGGGQGVSRTMWRKVLYLLDVQAGKQCLPTFSPYKTLHRSAPNCETVDDIAAALSCLHPFGLNVETIR